MAVPDFQSIMLPLLKHAADGKEHSMKDTRAILAEGMGLSPDDLVQMLPSGKQTVWTNRVSWAKIYLEKARLLEPVARGVYRITERGQKTLAENLPAIDLKYLSRFAEVAAFRAPSANEKDGDGTSASDEDTAFTVDTPEEIIAGAYREIRQALADELLEKLLANSPAFFENAVVKLLVEMGYGGDFEDAASVVGKSHDGGIDGIIKEDRLGLDKVYIQAKRWSRDNTVSAPEIQKFIGALHGCRAKKGVFITTSRFSAEARRYAENIDSHVVLIDGDTLAGYMIDFNVGVSKNISYELKKIDEDFFNEDI